MLDELVWKRIVPMGKKDRTLDKWSSNWEGPFRILQAFTNNAYEVEEWPLKVESCE